MLIWVVSCADSVRKQTHMLKKKEDEVRPDPAHPPRLVSARLSSVAADHSWGRTSWEEGERSGDVKRIRSSAGDPNELLVLVSLHFLLCPGRHRPLHQRTCLSTRGVNRWTGGGVFADLGLGLRRSRGCGTG